MIAKEAYDIFMKKNPSRVIQTMVDYDPYTFVVCATEGNKISYDDPYFSINKHDGKIKRFLPTLDIEKFDEAMDDREIDISKF